MKIVTCRQKGIYHSDVGLPCQDAIGSYKNNEVGTIVLCDGAGSVNDSEIISEVIAKYLPQFITDNFHKLYNASEDDIQQIITNQISIIANDYCDGMEPNCTLLVVSVSTSKQIIVIHVGDGIIMEIGKNSKILSFPENGENPNITYFLNDKKINNHMRVCKRDSSDNDVILLCSDGLSNLLYNRVDDEVAAASYKMAKWLMENEETYVQQLIANAMKETFQERTVDDMSVGLIEIVK